MHIPNIISLARVFLAPVIIWLIISGDLISAFMAFVLAGVSDAIDGFLAKRFHWQSELGSYLDPLADKFLLVSIFIALGIKGALPSWLAIAVVTRDLLIVIGVMLAWVLGKPLKMRPFWVSKANTTAQIALAAVVLADEAFSLNIAPLRSAFVWTVAVLTVASLGAYLNIWLKHLAGYETAPGRDGRSK